MAKYIYNYSKELWFINNGKSTIIKQGDLIKQDDIKYFLTNHPEKIICIEEDIIPDKDDLSDLKSLIASQSNQIKDLIDVIKSNPSQSTVIYKSTNSQDDGSVDTIKIEEPEFRLSIKDISTDDIIAVGGDSGDTLETSDIDLRSKLSKLSKLKRLKSS